MKADNDENEEDMAEGIESPATETDMISSPEPNSASPDHILQSGDDNSPDALGLGAQNTSPLMRQKTPGPVH